MVHFSYTLTEDIIKINVLTTSTTLKAAEKRADTMAITQTKEGSIQWKITRPRRVEDPANSRDKYLAHVRDYAQRNTELHSLHWTEGACEHFMKKFCEAGFFQNYQLKSCWRVRLTVFRLRTWVFTTSTAKFSVFPLYIYSFMSRYVTRKSQSTFTNCARNIKF